MAERLFEGFWHSFWTGTVQRAIAEVDRLDRGLFSDPNLGDTLQKIVNNYGFEVARLDAKAIEATPFEEERYLDDFGERRAVKIRRLRVKIPFTGSAESLRIAPTRSIVPSHRADIGRDSLTITVADDASAEGEIGTFCEQVQGNLDGLRHEYEQVKAQLEQAVFNAAERRKAQIAAENEMDSKRTFTVRR